MPTISPESSESLKRLVDEDGYFIDTDINQDDFIISSQPTPASDDSEVVDTPVQDEVPDDQTQPPEDGETETEPEEVEEEPENVEDEGVVLATDNKPVSYPKIQITELFIDPSSPKTDADDEFIELFNPNKTSAQLEGYVLQTGNTFSRSFTIPKLSISPGEYLALYSIDTGLPLSNSGSQARLLDPNGDVVFATSPYEKAKPDISWVLVGGVWQWSATPTPAAPNVAVAPATSTSKKASSKSSSSKSSTSKKSSSSPGDARIIYEDPASIEGSEINKAVLFGVGTLALGYAIYEYRHDISNRFHQTRRYFKSRR